MKQHEQNSRHLTEQQQREWTEIRADYMRCARALSEKKQSSAVDYTLQWEVHGHIGSRVVSISGTSKEDRDTKAMFLCQCLASEEMHATGCFLARPFDPVTDSDVERER